MAGSSASRGRSPPSQPPSSTSSSPRQPSANLSQTGSRTPSHQAHQAQPPTAPTVPGGQYTIPRSIPYNKRWHVTRLALHAASALWCILLISLTLATSAGGPVFLLALAGVALVWDIATLSVQCCCGLRFRAGKEVPTSRLWRPSAMHPGAHVGVDLLIWLAGILAAVLSGRGLAYDLHFLRVCDGPEEGWTTGNVTYMCDDPGTSTLRSSSFFPISGTVVALWCLLTITHFVIFVRACIETRQRNSIKVVLAMPQPDEEADVSTYPTQAHPAPQQPPMAHQRERPGSGDGIRG